MPRAKSTLRLLLTSGTLIEKTNEVEYDADAVIEKTGDTSVLPSDVPDDPFEFIEWFNDNWRTLDAVTINDHLGFDTVRFPVASIAALTITAERLTD